MEFKGFDENFSLAGKNAFITGAASGIGLEIAKMYARKGANIIAFDLSDTAELEKEVKAEGRDFLGYKGSVTSKADIDDAVSKAIEKFKKIDILVNCAGIGIIDDAENLSEDIWDKTMAVNLKGPFLLSQAVGNTMIKNGGGKIISISSQCGIVAVDKHVAYSVSKAGIISMTKQLAFEWGEFGISTNCISPTIILTPLGRRVWENEAGDAFKKTIPSGRFGYPEEVAACAVFLASDAANLINGANLVIDGGFTIC